MGTNYYVEDGKKCSKCGAGGESRWLKSGISKM